VTQTRQALLLGLAFNLYRLRPSLFITRMSTEPDEIMVVLGNPPYSGHSANLSRDVDGNLTFIGQKIEDYKRVDGADLGEKNPKWLQDDYVKFIRFAQWRIEKTGYGILAFITNHSYLDNPTFRGMRRSLMQSFGEIYVRDLHGNSLKRERNPSGGKDENVFDIMQGTAILLAIRQPGREGECKVRHAELWGDREKNMRPYRMNQ
jgi:predicted helicase